MSGVKTNFFAFSSLIPVSQCDMHDSDDTHLDEAIVWIDVETTGPDPETDELLEIGAHVTDLSGKIISQGYSSLVHLSVPSALSKASNNVVELHEKSGLWDDLWNKKTHTVQEIEKSILLWLNNYVNEDTLLYFGGNSITLDRNFVRLNLPKLYTRISHRSIDVTTLSIFLQNNSEIGPYRKRKDHRALLDVEDSILEYNHYRQSIEKFDDI